MERTPRLRSTYPASPPSVRTTPGQNGTLRGPTQTGTLRIPDMSILNPKAVPSAPLVSFDTVDAPSQRLYVAGFYIALFLWRLYDFYHLILDDSESLWLFMKWVSIDGVFLFGLPGLRIPWLEWSSSTMTVLFLLHAIFDGILMFRVPVSALFLSLTSCLRLADGFQDTPRRWSGCVDENTVRQGACNFRTSSKGCGYPEQSLAHSRPPNHQHIT